MPYFISLGNVFRLGKVAQREVTGPGLGNRCFINPIEAAVNGALIRRPQRHVECGYAQLKSKMGFNDPVQPKIIPLFYSFSVVVIVVFVHGKLSHVQDFAVLVGILDGGPKNRFEGIRRL